MSYNIEFTLLGPSGLTTKAPNITNPVVAENMREVLRVLAENLPDFPLDIEVIGVAIDKTGGTM